MDAKPVSILLHKDRLKTDELRQKFDNITDRINQINNLTSVPIYRIILDCLAIGLDNYEVKK